jgi:hypothetical protein
VLDAPFNMKQWTETHDAEDERRFGEVGRSLSNVWKVFGAAGAILVATLGWSLRTQYEAMNKQVDAAQAQLSAIQTVQKQVREMPDQLAVPKR